MNKKVGDDFLVIPKNNGLQEIFFKHDRPTGCKEDNSFTDGHYRVIYHRSDCGREGYEDIEEFGKAKQDWLRQYLQLPHGIPSHDTIERLFESINPEKFQICFGSWLQETFKLSDEQFLHIDGKWNRRSRNRPKGAKMNRYQHY